MQKWPLFRSYVIGFFLIKTAWFKSKSVISAWKDANKLKKTAIYTTKKMTQKTFANSKETTKKQKP